MIKDKVLLNISKIEDLEYYKKLGISNFLFPLKDYSIGYEEFTLEEIRNSKTECYILVNRLLKSREIDEFLKLEFPSNIKGFVIEDIGIYYALKGSKYELICYQNHLNNNYKTVNFWLRFFDSLVISTDITKEEVRRILDEASRPLIVKVLEYPMIMYSRRNLISNYNTHYELEQKKEINIKEEISGSNFFLRESEYGTAVFNNRLFDIRNELKEIPDDKVKFYYIDTNFLDKSIITNAINGIDLPNTTTGFFYKKTVFRIGDLK